MSTIQVRARFLSSDAALSQARSRVGVEEVDDAAAVTIASLYQSPGSIGHVLASFASGCPVDAEALLDDISRTARDLGGVPWPVELEMLSTWVLDRTSACRHDYKSEEN